MPRINIDLNNFQRGKIETIKKKMQASSVSEVIRRLIMNWKDDTR